MDTCLINLSDHVRSEISKGNFVGMVMIDLRKAFDTVDFNILLSKLKTMGVGNTDWFRSYLTGRRQCVSVGGTESNFLDIECGVPQGSILGPILFLCYINDMSASLNCRLSLYADDSTLIASGRDIQTLSTFLSGELESCSKWLVDNKLSLHVDKCESIVFATKRKMKECENFQVTCFGTLVRRVSSVKYLGVMLDENLSGESHVSAIIKKVSSRLSFLYRNSRLLDFQSKRTLCSALVQPFFDNSCSSWYSGVNTNLKNRLDVLQRKMVRYVLNMDFCSHVDSSHFRKLGWLKIEDRVRYFKLVHAFKIYKGLAPQYVCEFFTRSSSVHSYNTRGSQTDYFISQDDTRASYMINSFTYTAKLEWNRLPSDLKKISNLVKFKALTRAYLFESY